jgi:hypothetical protein
MRERIVAGLIPDMEREGHKSNMLESKPASGGIQPCAQPENLRPFVDTIVHGS